MTGSNLVTEICDICTKTITIIKTGEFRHHMDGDFRTGGHRCVGAGHAPFRVTAAVAEVRAEHGSEIDFHSLRARVRLILNPPQPEEDNDAHPLQAPR